MSEFTNIFIDNPKCDTTNGYIMSIDTPVALVSRDGCTIISETAPLYLQRCNDFEGWLRMRSIDSNRTHSRLLRHALRLGVTDDTAAVLYTNAATITDTYWFKSDTSNLNYEDVRAKNNNLWRLSLNGDTDYWNFQAGSTPDLTTVGSFEKCWIREHNLWYLIKSGSKQEIFSELFAYKLGTALGFHMAEYARYQLKGREYIKSRNFVELNQNFEPMYSILGNNEDLMINANAIKNLSGTALKNYIDIMFLDTIIRNFDRHTFNYGVIRDAITGKFLSIAPNFDNNLSLISRGYAQNVSRQNDMMIQDYNKLIQTTPNEYNKPLVTTAMLRNIALEISIDFDTEYIVKFCMNGYNQMN